MIFGRSIGEEKSEVWYILLTLIFYGHFGRENEGGHHTHLYGSWASKPNQKGCPLRGLFGSTVISKKDFRKFKAWTPISPLKKPCLYSFSRYWIKIRAWKMFDIQLHNALYKSGNLYKYTRYKVFHVVSTNAQVMVRRRYMESLTSNILYLHVILVHWSTQCRIIQVLFC